MKTVLWLLISLSSLVACSRVEVPLDMSEAVDLRKSDMRHILDIRTPEDLNSQDMDIKDMATSPDLNGIFEVLCPFSCCSIHILEKDAFITCRKAPILEHVGQECGESLTYKSAFFYCP
jgi:hypothetical protein